MSIFKRLSHRGTALIVIVFGLQAVFALVLGSIINDLLIYTRQAEHARRVLTRCYRLSNEEIKFALNVMSQYENHDYYNSAKGEYDYKRISTRIRKEVARVGNIVGADEQSLVDRLKDELEASLRLGRKSVGELIAEREQNYKSMALELYSSLDGISRLTQKIIDTFEEILARTPHLENEQRSRLKQILIIGLVANFGTAAILFAYLINRVTSRLAVLEANTKRVIDGEVLEPLVSGRDEIFDLEHAFHQMSMALTQRIGEQQDTINGALCMICSVSSDATINSINKACEKVLGFDAEELEGNEVYRIIEPSDQERLKEALSRSSELGPVEICMRNRSEQTVRTIWSIHWSEMDAAHFCVIHDVTELKEAEARLQRTTESIKGLIENLSVGLITLTADGLIDSVNQQAIAIFDSSTKDMVGKPAYTLFRDISREDLAGLLEEYSSKTIRLAGISQGDSLLYVDVKSTPLETESGDKYVLSIQEVSSIVAVEQNRHYYLHLMRSIVHACLTDLRVLLTEILEDERTTGAVRAKLEGIARTTDWLAGLVNQFLELRELDAGDIVVFPVNCKAEEILSDSVEAVKGLAEERGIAISSESESIDLMVDRNRLTQVTINLLANAIKFSRENSDIRLEAISDDDHFVVLVRDTGTGIAQDKHDSIFERFEQEDEHFGGSGFGLYICKLIVSAHGGDIGVESREEGNTFRYRIRRNVLTG